MLWTFFKRQPSSKILYRSYPIQYTVNFQHKVLKFLKGTVFSKHVSDTKIFYIFLAFLQWKLNHFNILHFSYNSTCYREEKKIPFFRDFKVQAGTVQYSSFYENWETSSFLPELFLLYIHIASYNSTYTVLTVQLLDSDC